MKGSGERGWREGGGRGRKGGKEGKVVEEVGALNKARPEYHPYDHVAHVQVVSCRGGDGRWEGEGRG